MFKTILDVLSVWTITLLANLGVEEFLDNIVPHIRDGLTIISVILAIIYTCYKFHKEWKRGKR